MLNTDRNLPYAHAMSRRFGGAGVFNHTLPGIPPLRLSILDSPDCIEKGKTGRFFSNEIDRMVTHLSGACLYYGIIILSMIM